MPESVDRFFEEVKDRGVFTELYGHVREGLAATYYHVQNVERLERAVLEVVKQGLTGRTSVVGVQMAYPGINNITAEYHAFQFASRRTLEYLAHAVASAFDVDPTSIYKLEAAVACSQAKTEMKWSYVGEPVLRISRTCLSREKASSRTFETSLLIRGMSTAGISA